MDQITVTAYWASNADEEVRADIARAVYDHDAIEPSQPLADLVDRIGWAEYDAGTDLDYEGIRGHLELKPRPLDAEPDLPSVRLTVPQHSLEDVDTSAGAQTLSAFLSLVESLYTIVGDVVQRPKYVIGTPEGQTAWLRGEFGGVLTTTAGVQADELEELYWVQVLPPAMLETLGRERVLSAPVWRAHELDDGGVLLVVGESPTDHHHEYVDTKDHLGLERHRT